MNRYTTLLEKCLAVVVAGMIIITLVTINVNKQQAGIIEVERQRIVRMSKTINNLKEELAISNQEREELIEELDRLHDEVKEQKKKIQQATRGIPLNKYTELGVFEVTAYDDTPQSQGKWVGQTATGVKPQHGVVAVDPRVIPLGSKIYVEGYGPCIAGDTGGAIKGRRIDVFFDSRTDVMNWGRQKRRVYQMK